MVLLQRGTVHQRVHKQVGIANAVVKDAFKLALLRVETQVPRIIASGR
jgi:hypothetical protein